MGLVTLAADMQKCATCERWDGPRQRAGEAAQVKVDADSGGKCIGGPWDGQARDPLTRCGRWVAWTSTE